MAWARSVRVAEPAGAVVDVEVVEGVGEQPRDLGDLAAVLGQMGLPVGARVGAARAADSRSMSAEQLTRRSAA